MQRVKASVLRIYAAVRGASLIIMTGLSLSAVAAASKVVVSNAFADPVPATTEIAVAGKESAEHVVERNIEGDVRLAEGYIPTEEKNEELAGPRLTSEDSPPGVTPRRERFYKSVVSWRMFSRHVAVASLGAAMGMLSLFISMLIVASAFSGKQTTVATAPEGAVDWIREFTIPVSVFVANLLLVAAVAFGFARGG